MKHHLHIILLSVLTLLVGCVAPTKTVVAIPSPAVITLPPPVPVKVFKTVKTTTKAMSTVLSPVNFTPASAELPKTPMWIVDFPGAPTKLVGALQAAGGTLTLEKADIIPFIWTFLASFGFSSSEQWVAVQIPSNWIPVDGRTPKFYVRATNTPSQAMLTKFLSAKPDKDVNVIVAVKIDKKLKKFRLMEIQQNLIPLKIYHLKPTN